MPASNQPTTRLRSQLRNVTDEPSSSLSKQDPPQTRSPPLPHQFARVLLSYEPEVSSLSRGRRPHTHTYLGRVDAALSGFVEGLYVVGSTALGAWQPPHSDVDTVIVTKAVTEDHLRVLAEVHEGMPASPKFDGVYLERPVFEAWVADRRVTPFVVNGSFKTDKECGELTPVLWTVLRRGIAVRGRHRHCSGLSRTRRPCGTTASTTCVRSGSTTPVTCARSSKGCPTRNRLTRRPWSGPCSAPPGFTTR
ncbi:nucleotidyltransferase domain-containing protein [Streptomyces sp. NPDC001282]|uniref:nucleotidyltransferase domain-containing protein n=1 Tax=Streptomyces sp. NPDC001282 TaxID=3364557 RepID=UPI0036B498E0